MLRFCIPRPISSAAVISTLVVVQRSSRRCIGRSSSFSSSTTNLQLSGDNTAIMQSSSADDNDNVGKQPTQRTTRRRTRRRSVLASNSSSSNNSDVNNNDNIPSLADFMHRAKVLKQYRNFIRLAQYVDEKDAAGNNNIGKTKKNTNDYGCRAALEEVRLSYKLGIKKGGVDMISKNMAYAEGERKLRELETMTGYSNIKKQSQSILKDLDDNAALPEYDADSWINIRDEEDTRGRVGVKWPWEKD